MLILSNQKQKQKPIPGTLADCFFFWCSTSSREKRLSGTTSDYLINTSLELSREKRPPGANGHIWRFSFNDRAGTIRLRIYSNQNQKRTVGGVEQFA